MKTVIGVVLGVCAVALVAAAALGKAPLLVLPTPWGVGLIGVAMLAVLAQPSAARSARTAAVALTTVGSAGAIVAWLAWLRGFGHDNAVGGAPDAIDSMVDLGSSTAALALAALLVVAGSASSMPGRDRPGAETTPLTTGV